jgi:hypothetical protein
MAVATIARKALTKGTQAARRAAAAAKKKAAKKAREAAKAAKKTSKKASQATRRATSSAKKRAKKTVGATKRAVKKANTEGIVLGGLAVEGSNMAGKALMGKDKKEKPKPARFDPVLAARTGFGRGVPREMKNGGNVRGRSKK